MPINDDYHFSNIRSQFTFVPQQAQIEAKNIITTLLENYLAAVFNPNYGLKDKRRHAVVDFINQIGEFSTINNDNNETHYLKALQHSPTPTRSESPTTITETEYLASTVIRPSSPIGVEQTLIYKDVYVTYGDAQKKQTFQIKDIPKNQFSIKSVINDYFFKMLSHNTEKQNSWAIDVALCELIKKLKRFHKTYFSENHTCTHGGVVDITFQTVCNNILELQKRLRNQKKYFCLCKIEHLQESIQQLQNQQLFSLSDLYIRHANPYILNVISVNVLRSRAEELHNQLTSYNSTPSAQTLNELQNQINDLQTEIGLLRDHEDKLRENKQQFEYDYKQRLTTIASLKAELRYNMRSINCTTEYQELDGIIQQAQGDFLLSMQLCIDEPSERQIFSINELEGKLQISNNILQRKNKAAAFWQRLENHNANYQQLKDILDIFGINIPLSNQLDETYKSIKCKIQQCYMPNLAVAQIPSHLQALNAMNEIEREIYSYKQKIDEQQRQFKAHCDLYKTLKKIKEFLEPYKKNNLYNLPYKSGRVLSTLLKKFKNKKNNNNNFFDGTFSNSTCTAENPLIDSFSEELIKKMTATGEQYQDVIETACWLKYNPQDHEIPDKNFKINRVCNTQNIQDAQLRKQIDKLKKECARLQAINKENSQEQHPKSFKIFRGKLNAKIIENARMVLENYIQVRQTGYSVGFFRGFDIRGTAFKKANKIESAEKLLHLLKGNNITLEPIHLKALQDKRLGEITSALESAGILSLAQNQLNTQVCRLPSIVNSE